MCKPNSRLGKLSFLLTLHIAPLTSKNVQVVPWLVCYAIATVVSLLAFVLKVKIFRDQMKQRRTEFVLEEEEQTDRMSKLNKHLKRYVLWDRSLNDTSCCELQAR